MKKKIKTEQFDFTTIATKFNCTKSFVSQSLNNKVHSIKAKEIRKYFEESNPYIKLKEYVLSDGFVDAMNIIVDKASPKQRDSRYLAMKLVDVRTQLLDYLDSQNSDENK